MTDYLNKDLPFNAFNDGSRNDNFITEFIKVDYRETLIFSWIKLDLEANKPFSTYVNHQFCGGYIGFYDIGEYKFWRCGECGLKQEFPIGIKTVNDFLKYYRKNMPAEEEVNRAELLDFEDSSERIKAAAIKRNDGVVSTGKDHAEVFKKSPFGTCKAGSVQGFVTNSGRFVDRKEAAKIAFNAGQISKYEEGQILLSEEIWLFGEHKYDEEKGYYLP
jgi:hypothetical protein